MEIMNAIGKVLALGCGTSLSKVLRSKRYEALSARNNTIETRHNVNSDTGVALRAGHMEFGRLINTVGEKMAIVEAKNIHPVFGLGMELRPLIQITGECIVRAAKKCLTPQMREMAAKWKTCTADQQIEICRSLYQQLRSTDQEAKGELTMDIALNSLESHMYANAHDHKKVLPRQYGIWNADSCVANCQGKTQMVVAFARMARAHVIVAHPLKHAGRVRDQIRCCVFEKIVSDIQKRGLTHLDKPFAESLRAEEFGMLSRAVDDYFHVCACIEVNDGRWVLIDPHGLNFGILPLEWNMGMIVEQLERYKEVLPGLHLCATDKGRHQELFKIAEKRVEELLTLSNKLEKQLQSATNPMELVYALRDSGEVPFMFENFSEHGQEITGSREGFELASMVLALGPDFMDPFRIMSNENFMIERKHSLITTYHCVAMNEFKNQWTDDGTLIHPECEFTNSEYSIAISAINSLVDRYGPEVNRFFLDYSFDQTSMYNALGELMSFRWSSEKDERIGLAAARSLKALPIRHSLCSERMSMCRI